MFGRSGLRTGLRVVLGAGLVWGALGCAGEGDNGAGGSGAVDIEVGRAALSGADVASLEITVEGPGIDPPIVATLDPSEGSWRGAITGIPPGSDRMIVADAYDDAGTLIFTGRATGVSVADGEVVTVWLTLQQVAPSVAYINFAPRFVSLVASATQVAPGGVIRVRADATDPNGGPLMYAWTATAGTFDDPSGGYAEWTAPGEAGTGPQTLTVSVSDPQGATATARLAVIVGEVRDGGAAVVGVDVNSAPVVEQVTASEPSFDVGQPVRIDLTATDPDGDSLAFHWYAFCRGSFDDDRAEDPTFSLQTLPPAGQDCAFVVRVEDGRGGVGAGLFVAPSGPAPTFTTGIPVPGDPDATVSDSLGNAYALWSKYDASTSLERIYGNRFTPEEGWEPTAVLDVASRQDRHGLRLLLQPNGDALAFWAQSFIGDTFWTSTYRVGLGWDGEPTELGGGYDGGHLDIASDPVGRVTAVWHEDDSGPTYLGFGVWAARFDPELGWGPSARISGNEPEVPEGLFPDVEMDAAGNALVMWSDYDYGNPDPIYRWCYYAVGAGWGSPEPFGPLLDHFVMHAEGDADAYYMEMSGGEAVVYVRHFDPTTGFGPPAVVETAEGAATLQLALD